jgi:hypothetical protein
MFPEKDAFPRCRTGLLRRMLPAYFELLRNARNIRSRVQF